MKNLIRILASIAIFGASSLSVISCESNNKKNIPDFNELTQLQDEMVSGAQFLTKLILLSRHENLNYNLNEILSIYLSPKPTMLMMPLKYSYNEEKINAKNDLSKFTNLLAPKIEKMNGSNYAGVFASYIMGMYNDDFYNNFINNDYFEDSFNENGYTGFNKSLNNELGLFAGLSKDLKLSENENRRNLAWGIQDTGALTNYLLNNGFDGGYPGGTSGIKNTFSAASDINGGTNSSGYLFYNSILANGKSNLNSFDKYKNKGIEDKLNEGINYKNSDENEYSSSINNKKFNKIGSMFAKTAGKLNFKGYLNNFSALLDSIDESDFGAEVLLNVLDSITPILPTIDDKVNLIIQSVSFGLLYNIQNAINDIQKDSTLSEFLSDKGFDKNILESKLDERELIDPISQYNNPNPNLLKVTRLFEKQENDKNTPNKNLSIVSDFLNELKKLQIRLYEKNEYKDFVEKFYMSKDAPFRKSYNVMIDNALIGGIGEENYKEIVKENGSGITNLFNLISLAYEGLNNPESQEILTSISKEYNNVGIKSLTRSQKLQTIKKLGYDYSTKKYKENSIFSGYMNLLKNTNTNGVTELQDFFGRIVESTSNDMKELHENALQYIYDNKYWNSTNVYSSATDPSEIGGKIKFTLKYTGVGDIDSNASSQFNKIQVPENFNPYQTIVENQKEFINNKYLTDKIDNSKVSGKVLGKSVLGYEDEDLIKYDGYGENYDSVEHTYDITWENISKNSETPHWVIVDIVSKDKQGKEFYNIY
ncbi:hypothetical protein [Spiroplasma turonicum]|uniref:Lipoprotein n=1 Tax=Spiroplasma turonicum TaxID=216946 RepID=A0A0K1P5U8_9MOLU|nr:hypothetical protein [Spiroplasma turonicum]AKU79630.1 hypothetical protein STURON_00384 [Spiroplasma turonicum]ALX70651.1 hypothetical protein STURO_v1c03830 [Spiroplasma turonicum]